MEKFVVHLVDEDNQSLAWAEVQGIATPQGRPRSGLFRAAGATSFAITRSGTVTGLLIHWCALDLVRRAPLAETPVQAGQVFTFMWIDPVWLVPGGGYQGVLPSVEVGTQLIGVPQATLGARDSRLIEHG